MISKENLLHNWHLMRILRLGIGIFIAQQAIQNQDLLSGLIATFFLYQAISNTGCCGTNACVTSPKKDNKHTQEVTFEEIK
ncbi:MAG: hypothetical protein RL711_337 [Bacteroidota bacterium]|jgi:hypothetical protein